MADHLFPNCLNFMSLKSWKAEGSGKNKIITVKMGFRRKHKSPAKLKRDRERKIRYLSRKQSEKIYPFEPSFPMDSNCTYMYDADIESFDSCSQCNDVPTCSRQSPDLESMGPVCSDYAKDLTIPSCSNDREQRTPNSRTYEAPRDPRPLCDDNATSSFSEPRWANEPLTVITEYIRLIIGVMFIVIFIGVLRGIGVLSGVLQ